MNPQEVKPLLHNLLIGIIDFDQPLADLSFEVLLRLLVYEGTFEDGPEGCSCRERGGSFDGDSKGISSSNGKLGVHLEVLPLYTPLKGLQLERSYMVTMGLRVNLEIW